MQGNGVPTTEDARSCPSVRCLVRIRGHRIVHEETGHYVPMPMVQGAPHG
jgi:hypothetical protein